MPVFRPACWLLSFLVLLPARPAQAEQHFRIVDRLGPIELEESTTIYMDDVLIGSFRLDRQHPDGAMDGAVPDAPRHTYRLCGKVITQDPVSGEVTVHPVDTTGTVDTLDGHVFEAMTTDFTSYMLNDVSPWRPRSRIERNQGRGCTPVVS